MRTNLVLISVYKVKHHFIHITSGRTHAGHCVHIVPSTRRCKMYKDARPYTFILMPVLASDVNVNGPGSTLLMQGLAQGTMCRGIHVYSPM